MATTDEGRSEFIDSLMDTELYSIGAYFCDEHPELVDEVIALSDEIEQRRPRGIFGRRRRGARARPSRPCSPGSRCGTTRRSRAKCRLARGRTAPREAALSSWVPRVLLALGLLGIAAAIYSLSVGTGGPQPQAIGGVNDVQRIFGGIAQDGAYIGPEDATTTITVFNDLQCAPCADWEINTIDPLVEKYARTGDARLEFRHFSLAPNDTTLAAIAAEAAGKQSRQWQYLDTFVRNIEVTKTRAIDETFLREVAEAVPELDPPAVERGLQRPRHRGARPPGRDARRGSEAARRAGGGRFRARRPARS